MTHTDAGRAASLAPLAFWKARSFWLTLATVATALLGHREIDLPGLIGYADPDGLADAVLAVLPAFTAAGAWQQRLRPTRRLTLHD